MNSITLGQIIAVMGSLTAIVGFFAAVFKWYKSTFSDRFFKGEKRIKKLEELTTMQEQEIKESKEERLILLQGLLACLKGLKEQGCNGPVTKAISDIEIYLVNKTHE